jgi:hypothetical protein
LLRSKCLDDASLSAPVPASDNQDHLFGDMAVNIHPSFCLQTSVSGDKHYVFSSDFLFQKAIQNSINFPWIIDAGATDHMVCSLSFLTTITSIVSRKVKLPNRSFAEVTHIGTVKINATLTLTNVLCSFFFF